MAEIKQNIDVIVFASIFFILFLIGFFGFLFYYIRKFYRVEIEKAQMKREFETELALVQQEIQEATLRHVSRELHDNLGQMASLIKINLNTMQPGDSPMAPKIEQTKELTKRLIMAIKSLSVSLGSDGIEQLGLLQALQQEVDRVNAVEQFRVELNTDINSLVLTDHQTLILYRMAQELINNSLKHSRALHLNISAAIKQNLFTLAFSDDGVGFNVAEKMNAGGAGLKNLQTRASMIGAHIQFTSEAHNGTTVVIELPQ